MNDRNKNVFVLGNDTRSFLTVIRSLGRKGIKVHIGWTQSNCAAKYSRYVFKNHYIPPYSQSREDWKKVFIDILKRERFDLVIPCDDPCIIPLQFHQREFQGLSKIYLLDDYTYKITNNKMETRAIVQRLGIPVPKQIEIYTQGQLDDVASRLGFPVVLKAMQSYSTDNLKARHEVHKAFHFDELRLYYTQMQGLKGILAQEHFNGFGCGVEIIADRGVILSSFQHERIHEPLWGGGGSYRKSVSPDLELNFAAEKIIKDLNYTGVAMLEFKKNPTTGQWVFLEINARFWGSLPLAVASGMDFPWFLYDLLVNGRPTRKRHYRQELYCRNLVADLEWLRANIAADHTNPYLHTVPLKKVACELGNLLSLNERSDTFQLDDPMPGVADLYFYIGQKMMGLGKKIGRKVMSLPAVKRLTQRRIARAIQQSRAVHFVCYGNICRSPFAHRYGATVLSYTIQVTSSGIKADSGRRCPRAAVNAAVRFGVDLSGHQAAPLQAHKRCSEIYLVFDCWNLEMMHAMHPELKGRVFPLGYFLNGGGLFIEDPFGRSDETFQHTYHQIVEAIDGLQRALSHR